MSSSTKKRKFGDEAAVASTKYYAVRKGHMPGVYTDYKDCLENTTGFKGAIFKSFLSEKDARDFVAGKNPGSAKPQEDKFYGVAVGRVPGVYLTWPEAERQIHDVKGPKYKKFATREEAEDFVKTVGKAAKAKNTTTTTASSRLGKEVGSQSEFEVEERQGPTSKKAKRNSKPAAATSKPLKIWTDGSSRGNGKIGASAGVGVFFAEGDIRNVSEPLQGMPQTNQRAELAAILRALQIVPQIQSVEITTDSSYSINCCKQWVNSWIKNGWKTSTGGQVLNKDLVESIKALMDTRSAKGAVTEFTWVKGHGTDPGNVAADRLAVAGAMAARY